MKEQFRDYGIEVPSGKTSGEVQTTCPKCSHTRKKKTDKCLSINIDKSAWHCFHCGWGGILRTLPKKTYTRPQFNNVTTLTEKAVKFFLSRGISQGSLIEAKITSGNDWMPKAQKETETIRFNYFRNGELINVKYRGANKDFKLHKDSELIFYNLDCLLSEPKSVYIVEGEMDALTLIELGFKNVVSVPNGASINANLEYVDNCIDDFDNVEQIILCCDNDLAGRHLTESLRIRFGLNRCSYIDLGNHKDINEVLIKDGKEAAKEVLTNIKDYPIDGVFTVSDFDNEIMDMYYNGLEMGYETGMTDFDRHLTFALGYMNCITGIPNHGKSDYLDQITLSLAIKHNLSGAYFSPENKPTKLHFSKLARKITGKNWYGLNKLNIEELNRVKSFLDDKVFFIKPKEGFTIDNILEKVEYLVRKKGLKWFVIDAWNTLEDDDMGNTHKFIGRALTKIALFCEKLKIMAFIVAHPKKLYKDKSGATPVPTAYDIADSSHFFNKMDNIICVHRDFENGHTEIHIQKVKFSHWGKQGNIQLWYDLESGRYYDTGGLNKANWLDVIHGKYIEVSEKESKLGAVKAMKEAAQLSIINPFENYEKEAKEFNERNDNLPF